MSNPYFQRLAKAAMLVACWPLHSARSQQPAVAAGNAVHASGISSNPTIAQPCALLRNDNVLFGHAVQVGEFVVIRTGQGGEVQLPRTEVACWAESIRDLYRYRVDHRRKGDIAAHFRDAKWCLRYDLFDLAAEEIRTIRTLDPQNVEVGSIEAQLKRLTSPTPASHSSLIIQSAVVQPAGYEESESELGPLDLSIVRAFAKHVQPMLLNRCGQCHSQNVNRETAGGWTLEIPAAGARASSRMTRENLASLLPYINRGAIEESELLVKATTPHGGGGAPLDARSAKAIESLKAWLYAASSALPESRPDHSTGGHNEVDSQVVPPAPVTLERPVMTDQARPSNDVVRQPERLPQVANPFDPDLFNRRFYLNSADAK